MEGVCCYSKVILTDWSAASVIKHVESLEEIIPIVPIIKEAAIPANLSIAISVKENLSLLFLERLLIYISNQISPYSLVNR